MSEKHSCSFFAPRVPDPAYRPVAGSVPTTDGGQSVIAGHGFGGARVAPSPAIPIEQGAPVPAHGSAAVPGSVPSVIQDIAQPGALPAMSSQQVATKRSGDASGFASASVIPIRVSAVTPAIVTVEMPQADAAVHYPRNPIKRHKRRRL